jgi:hypothetical protein
MAEYPIREQDNGDFLLEIDGQAYRITARREVPSVTQRAIALEGTVFADGLLAGKIQVSSIKYEWPDGFQKWGAYHGSLHDLEAL